MPPWLPEQGAPPIVGERGLASGQIALIREWIEEGTLEGNAEDLAKLPPLPARWSGGLSNSNFDSTQAPSLIHNIVLGEKPGGSGNQSSDEIVSYELPVPVSALGVWATGPASLRRLELRATLPDGATTSLLLIRNWRPRWQESYRYTMPIPLPKGTVLSFFHINEAPKAEPADESTGSTPTNSIVQVVLRVQISAAADLEKLK